MENEFDIVLSGSDGPVEGVARQVNTAGENEAYEFKSTDETIHLVITQQDGHWVRIAGTDPYFIGWPVEMMEQINFQRN